MRDASSIPAGSDPELTGPLSRPAALQVLEQADALAGAGEYEQALRAYTRVVGHRDADVHVAALLGVAECRYRLDDEEAALQAWIVATQAPETPLTWRAWKQLAAARVRSGDLTGAARSYREADRRAPPDERPEIASRLGWLNKEMGNTWAAQRHFGRSRTDVGAVPLVTYGILAVTVVIGIMTLFGTEELWYRLFALDKQAVRRGEWYRLVSVVLVHDNRMVLHLLFNMYALYLVGPIVEALYGHVRFLAVYLVTAAGASTLSYVLNPFGAGVGASGAVFGLFGALFVADRVYRPALGRQARAMTAQIGALIAFNLVFGLAFPRIDNAAHVGGLISGAWLGLVLRPRGVTLATFWQRPGGSTAPVGPAGPAGITDASRKVSGASLLGVAGFGLLVAVIAVAVGLDVRLG